MVRASYCSDNTAIVRSSGCPSCSNLVQESDSARNDRYWDNCAVWEPLAGPVFGQPILQWPSCDKLANLINWSSLCSYWPSLCRSKIRLRFLRPGVISSVAIVPSLSTPHDGPLLLAVLRMCLVQLNCSCTCLTKSMMSRFVTSESVCVLIASLCCK